jgi:hypothetical protein
MRRTTSYYARKAKSKADKWIGTVGKYVTVTRGTVSKDLLCLPQPLSYNDAVRLKMEGVLNSANAMPRRFIFLGDDTVEANDSGVNEKDLVDDDGVEFRIVNVTPTRLNDITIMRVAIGVRSAEDYRGL